MTAATTTTTASHGGLTFTHGATAMTATTTAQAGHKAPTTALTAFQATTGATAPMTASDHWQAAMVHLHTFLTILGLHLRMAFDRWQRRLMDNMRPHIEVLTDQAAAAWRHLPTPTRQAAVAAWPHLQAFTMALTMAVALTVWEAATFTAAVAAAAFRRQWEAAMTAAREAIRPMAAMAWIRLTSG